jgi:prephenate dehydratase
MRIGYLGPEGTFSHEVAARGAGADDELVALPTNHDVVVAVQTGAVERAVAPVENLIDGAVTAVLDALAFEAPEVSIVGEDVALVRHVLCAATPLELDAVTAVSSHPVALAQCGVFLRERLPHAELRPASSTAEAVRSVSGTAAAIGTAAAAARYDAAVLVEGIEDDAGNRTRFAWLARDAAEVADGPDIKTSVIFHGHGDGSPGWLVRCLSEFAFRGVNLTKIESRPLRLRLGHYRFFVDCEGSATSGAVGDAVEGLRKHCEQVRILGSFGT